MSVYDTMTAGLSGVGLILLGFVTTHGTSDYHLNALQMQSVLQARAQTALNEAGLGWAHVEMDGQRAAVSGTAPSAAAASEAADIVLTSSGQGGMLYGGVISVESSVTVAAPAPVTAPPAVPDVVTDADDSAIVDAESSDAGEPETAPETDPGPEAEPQDQDLEQNVQDGSE